MEEYVIFSLSDLPILVVSTPTKYRVERWRHSKKAMLYLLFLFRCYDFASCNKFNAQYALWRLLSSRERKIVPKKYSCTKNENKMIKMASDFWQNWRYSPPDIYIFLRSFTILVNSSHFIYLFFFFHLPSRI